MVSGVMMETANRAPSLPNSQVLSAKKPNYLLIASLLTVVLLVGVGGVYLGIQIGKGQASSPTASSTPTGTATTPSQPAQTSITTPTGTSAGSVEKLTFGELILKADVIVLGTVEAIDGAWDQTHSTIYTDVTVIPGQWIKGKATTSPLVVRIPGGEVGDAVASVEDAPEFKQGEQVVLFLRQGEESWFQVVGGFQGKFTVEDGRVLGPLSEFLARIQSMLPSGR